MTKKKTKTKRPPPRKHLARSEMIGRFTDSGGKIVQRLRKFRNSKTGDWGTIYLVRAADGAEHELPIQWKDQVPWRYRKNLTDPPAEIELTHDKENGVPVVNVKIPKFYDDWRRERGLIP